MNWMRIIAALISLSLLAACNKQKETSAAKQISINLQEGDPPSLNPYVGVDLRSRCLYLALFEPLMRRNGEGNLEFASAERVEIDPSQTIYTFHLRPNRWSNGEPVTSRHFAEAWKYALTPGACCIRADLFYPIKNGELVKKGKLPLSELKIFTPDEKTLVVELEHPVPYFLDLTATSFFSPLFETTDKDPTCFNGPFSLKERVRDQRLVLSKNPSYWDREAVDLDEIKFTMVKDPMTALSMYERGELDLVGDPYCPLPLDVIPSLEKAGSLKSKIISRIFYLLLNVKSPAMQNASFRKALAFSIDREQLTEHLFFHELPTFSPLPKPLALLEENAIEATREDPLVLFKRALSELNLTRDNFPKITFSYAELSGQKRLAEFLQDQWKQKLGIDVEICSYQWNTHIANIRSKNYQIGTLHLTTLYQDPMFYFEFFKDSESLSNYCGWESPLFRRLLEKSDWEQDPQERRKSLELAERELMEQMPAIPLFTQNLQYLVKDGLNLAITDLGIYDFKKIKFER